MRARRFDAHPSSDVIRGYDQAMPRLACLRCGRQVYSVAILEAMSPEERRCPRCGAHFNLDRREGSRRETNRRRNPPDDPGPPGGVERRDADRRENRPRRSSEGQVSTRRSSDFWQD
jgi:DNA-directed RNA polymerase subunit RPC12/RpoP